MKVLIDWIEATLIGAILIIVIVFLCSLHQSKPDPPLIKKYCTIKLNDANKQTSYVTGECV